MHFVESSFHSSHVCISAVAGCRIYATVTTSSVRAFPSLWSGYVRPLRLVRTDGLVQD